MRPGHSRCQSTQPVNEAQATAVCVQVGPKLTRIIVKSMGAQGTEEEHQRKQHKGAVKGRRGERSREVMETKRVEGRWGGAYDEEEWL